MKAEIETVNKSTGEIISTDAWNLMRAQAETLIKSGFLPVAVNTPEKAIAIMQAGKELGVPPMTAFQTINVIQGKISVSPQLMLALARKTGELEDFHIEKDDKGAKVTIKRLGKSPVTTYFGVKEATSMGLINKDNWKKQFSVMAQWRALAENLRLTFGDAIAGVYSYDEMGGEMDAEGNLVSASRSVPMPKTIEQTKPIETEAVKNV